METLKAYQSFASQSSSSSGGGGGATSLVNGSQKPQQMSQQNSQLGQGQGQLEGQQSGQTGASLHSKKTINVGQKSRFLFDVDEEDDEEDEDYADEDTDPRKRQYSSYGMQNSGTNSSESSAKRARRQQLARTNHHMTRNRAANDPSLTRTSSSVFNIPTLSRVHVLLQTIDSARKERDRVFQEYITRRQQQQLMNSTESLSENLQSQAQNPLSTGAGGCGGGSNRGFLTSITAQGKTRNMAGLRPFEICTFGCL
jgi:hypothetical protein